MAQGQFIKVYHQLKDEFPGVWRSDAQLALFVRLLLVADKWWPEWAPVTNRSGAYRSLVEGGLVIENQGASGYTIKGLGPERSKRSQHGRHAASMRWASSEHAQPMPSRAEQNKAEQTNGQSPPQTFMGWKPKAGRLPGEAVLVVHDGKHRGAESCLVCQPPVRKARKPLKSKPKGVNLALRQSVFERDGYVCQWCRVPGGHLDPHHILRRSQGGKDTLDNLISLHRLCHTWIHDHPEEASRSGFLRSAYSADRSVPAGNGSDGAPE